MFDENEPHYDIDAMAGLVAVESGFSSTIYRDTEGHRIRVARTADAALLHQREARLQAVVAPHLSVEIPVPIAYVEPSPSWQFGAYVSPWLSGERVDASVDERSVARSLREINQLDPEILAGIAVPFDQWCQQQRKAAEAGIHAAARTFDDETWEWLRSAIRHGSSRVAQVSEPRVVHGDLWFDNMLMRKGQLTGVLDWEHAGVGDSAADLAGLWYLGEDFVHRVCGDLGWDLDQMLERVNYFRLVRELYGVAWSQCYDDADEFDESTAKLITVVHDIQRQ